MAYGLNIRDSKSVVGIERAEPQTSGLVFDIKRYAIHDGPGIRTTVFFKGCPLSCRWCHNPESWRGEPELGLRSGRCVRCGRCVEACTAGALSLGANGSVTDAGKCRLCGRCVDACLSGAREIIGRKMTASEVIAEIERDLIFYDESGGGATFSGGEPLMQPDFLLKLLQQCRSREIHTAVDTTCHAEPDLLEKVAAATDLFLCDFKHVDREMHRRFTGVDNDLILKNIRRLADAGKQIVIRIPIVAGFNDYRAAVEMAGKFAASLPNVEEIDILPYNSGGLSKAPRLMGNFDLMQAEAPDDEKMAAIAEVLGGYGFQVKIGG
ncbi:MAG: glycyl-radical enzyme activating protein [Phycisphaerales bacterium]|nr:MAG: glycyl-radical enzyme activating protein [Phycisphaerales bacterium]